MAHRDVDKTGTCRMCAETALLEKGHVIPAFVYRWLKDTSATGYLQAATLFGDPLLDRLIYDRIALVRQHGLRAVFSTNALMLTPKATGGVA